MSFVAKFALLGFVACSFAVNAFVIQTSATLPPTDGFYSLGTQCIPAFCITGITFGDFVPISSQIIGGNQVTQNTAKLRGTVYTNVGNLPGVLLGPVVLTGPIDITYYGRPTLEFLDTFISEIVYMNLMGTFNSHTIEARLNPNKKSLGETSITGIEGEFFIDSFFDVFAELSIDGGPFIPGPVRQAVLQGVPEPGASGLVLVGLAGLALRARVSSRRR